MTYDPAALPSVYTPNALEKLSNMGGLGAHNTALHQIDREQIRGLRTEFGLEAGASDALGYVRMGDDNGKGLWVPASALAGPGILINSNFDHFQRSTAAVTSTTTFNRVTSFAADRFFVLPAGASVTQQRATTVPDVKSFYSLLITGAASVTTVDVGQRIRSLYQSRYKTSLLFSAYVRNVSGAAYTPTLRVDTPGAADDWTTPTNRLSVSLQECADSAWTRVYYVFDPSGYTNIANGMSVYLRIPSGSSVSGDTNYIAQFDLRPSTGRLDFMPPDPEEELLRCLRYAYVAGGGNAREQIGAGHNASTTTARAPILFPVPMWTTPTSSVSAVTDFSVVDAAGAAVACSNLTFGFDTPRSTIGLATVASGLVAGDATRLEANTTNARLYAIAELT